MTCRIIKMTHINQHDSFLLLERYLPNIFLLVNEVVKYRENVIRSYEKKYSQLKEEIESKGEYVGQTTIFDLLWDASEGVPGKKEFLFFIDNVVNNIISNIDRPVINQVRKMCYRMITNFSEDRSEYTRSLSELCVLEKIIRNKLSLVQVEKKLSNGRTFDFHFRSENKDTYVEVYNIDFNAEKIESDDSFKNFIQNRLEKKISNKIRGIIKDKYNFIFIPVLWGEIGKLAKYKYVFESFKEYKFLSPFMMISEYVLPNNEYFYTFEPVLVSLQRAGESEAE